MPKIPHTIVRHRRYYLRQRVPSDLVASFGGQKEIIKSLGTSCAAEARRKLAVERVQLLASFETQRRALNAPAGQKRPIESLTARNKRMDVQRLAQEGLPPTEIARRLQIGRSSVYRFLD